MAAKKRPAVDISQVPEERTRRARRCLHQDGARGGAVGLPIPIAVGAVGGAERTTSR